MEHVSYETIQIQRIINDIKLLFSELYHFISKKDQEIVNSTLQFFED